MGGERTRQEILTIEEQNLVISGFKLAIPAFAMGLAGKIGNRTNNLTANYNGDVTYSDAVRAINDSDMFSSDRREVISKLQRNENTEFYKAVISIAISDMFSSDKAKTIINMNKNTKKEEEK